MNSKKYICIIVAIILLIIYFYPAETGSAPSPVNGKISTQSEIEKENARHKSTSEKISVEYDSKIKELRIEIGRIKQKYDLFGGCEKNARELKATDRDIKALKKELINLESKDLQSLRKTIKIRRRLAELSDKREQLFNIQCAAETVKEKEKLIYSLQSAKKKEKEEENRLHEENIEKLDKSG